MKVVEGNDTRFGWKHFGRQPYGVRSTLPKEANAAELLRSI
jgi:hypothetical protein